MAPFYQFSGEKMDKSYNSTIYASYIGYITQAVVNNFAPLLFITFNSQLGISMELIALLITINFGTQLTVDYLSEKFVGRVGTRFAVVTAHFFSAAGLFMLSFMPFIAGFWGIVLSTVTYAIGGGLIEVIISPIVEACPTKRKAAAMSLLHSFYCWGQLFTVLVSTVFFKTIGIDKWYIMSCIWALIPLFNAFWFMYVPINSGEVEKTDTPRKELFSSAMFWILLVLMLCAGASELGMSQWASAFAEDALKVDKTIGDLAGPCLFAALMGISRVFYARFSHRISITRFMTYSCILCIITYLAAGLSQNPVISLIGCAVCGFSVGIMWPGTYSIAAGKLSGAGVLMFSTLALAGDLGCSVGPGVIGAVSSSFGLKLGMLAGIIFPCLMLVGIILLKKVSPKKSG